MAYKQKDLVKNTRNKYLKPGALAQIHKSRTAAKCLIEASKTGASEVSKKVKAGKKVNVCSTLVVSSPKREQHKLSQKSQPPQVSDFHGDSRLESLPIELLIEIMCHLHHDQLRAPFHVSRRIREAVIAARRWYFDYKTPDRSRLQLLRMKTPLPSERWPFSSNERLKSWASSNPPTPKARKHWPRSRHFNDIYLRDVSVALFRKSRWPSKLSSSSSLPSRVLFSEDELCRAVTENKIS